jgi:hypothetical protein
VYKHIYINVFVSTYVPDVAQSKAVSPAPSTITVPYSTGSWVLQAHMPGFEARATWEPSTCIKYRLQKSASNTVVLFLVRNSFFRSPFPCKMNISPTTALCRFLLICNFITLIYPFLGIFYPFTFNYILLFLLSFFFFYFLHFIYTFYFLPHKCH